MCVSVYEKERERERLKVRSEKAAQKDGKRIAANGRMLHKRKPTSKGKAINNDTISVKQKEIDED